MDIKMKRSNKVKRVAGTGSSSLSVVLPPSEARSDHEHAVSLAGAARLWKCWSGLPDGASRASIGSEYPTPSPTDPS